MPRPRIMRAPRPPDWPPPQVAGVAKRDGVSPFLRASKTHSASTASKPRVRLFQGSPAVARGVPSKRMASSPACTLSAYACRPFSRKAARHVSHLSFPPEANRSAASRSASTSSILAMSPLPRPSRTAALAGDTVAPETADDRAGAFSRLSALGRVYTRRATSPKRGPKWFRQKLISSIERGARQVYTSAKIEPEDLTRSGKGWCAHRHCPDRSA